MKTRIKLPRLVIFAVCFATLLVTTASAQWNPLNPVTGVKQQADGVVLQLESGVLKLQVCSDSIVRVMYSPTDSFPQKKEYLVIKDKWAATQWTMQSTDKDVSLITSKLKVTVLRANSSIHFTDLSGKQLFEESQRRMVPVVVNGENTYHAEIFETLWGSMESFYGLGQHQAGVWNYRGEAVDISEDNTNISIPMYLSTYGYGVFWNNTSRSKFNNRFLNALFLSSEVADVIDYYFIYGPEFDQIVAGYRDLTGAPPMFGKWAYGFWQCKKLSSRASVVAANCWSRRAGLGGASPLLLIHGSIDEPSSRCACRHGSPGVVCARD